jgi:tetratricopeptide (TPR) repeat protein
MSRYELPRWRNLAFMILILSGLVGIGLISLMRWLGRDDSNALPEPGSPSYEKYAEAFNIGVAALDFDIYDSNEPAQTKEGEPADLAYLKLTLAIETIPQEPAAWANRCLWYLRRQHFDAAANDLQKAMELAPNSPEIHRIAGILEDYRGTNVDAASHFRQALELDPDHVPTLLSLAAALEREGDNDQEVLRLLNIALKVHPDNLTLLGCKGKISIRLADHRSLAEVLATYRLQSASWTWEGSAEAKSELDDLEREAKGPLNSDVAVSLTSLDALLFDAPSRRRDMGLVYGALDRGRFVGPGQSVNRFLRLRASRFQASPPELDLSFEEHNLTAKLHESLAKSKWQVVLPVSPCDNAEPTVFVADSRVVRGFTAAGPVLSFPSGPKEVLLSSHSVLPVDWNNDFRTDFLLAGSGGLRFFEQNEDGSFSDVTAKSGLSPEVLNDDYYGAWAAEINASGDLDLLVAPRKGPPIVLSNGRDGSFKVTKPFSVIPSVREFVWADLDQTAIRMPLFLMRMGNFIFFRVLAAVAFGNVPRLIIWAGMSP